MESLYYVITWLCHRTCPHCYEDRFRPYYGPELREVTAQSRTNFARIIENLPPRMTYLDRADGMKEKTGSVILAGGEVLLDPIREPVLYPALQLLHEKYRDVGGVKPIVQTTGDLLTPRIVEELRQRHVWMISVSGIDAFHAGLEEESAQVAMKDKLTKMLESGGFELMPLVAQDSRKASDNGHYFHFFGATPDMWIGKLWPRGRAWQKELSTAGVEDNFCNRWSGGLGFLDTSHSGSEVSIDPEGNVFPCCAKTKQPVGNAMKEPLLAILDRLRGNPVYEAISAGQPERMGLTHGWSVEKFLEKSTATLSSGREYRNLCIGCDAFHDEVLRRDFVQLR